MDKRLKRLKWNSTSALFYQVILIISGLILPRCYLYFYGSKVNGLISSISQFLSFINICDLGISAVVSSALYKPLANKDIAEISRIFLYAKKFFCIVGFILLGYVAILLFVYPFIVANSFSYTYTLLLILAMSISQFAQYFIGISYQILLNSDQKSYVQLIINGITLILNTAMSIMVMYMGGSVQILKLLTSLIYLFRPILMYLYVKKNYQIDYTVKTSSDVIPQKWNGVIQHVSYMIYENTDIIVLTLFSSLSNVSIYSVYLLVVNSIKSFINAATTGVQALFGNMIAKNETENLQRSYDFYDWGIHTISTLLYTITGILIVPFVMIYTKNINDADYNVPLFSLLITLAFTINTIRNGMYILIRSAGHYKKTQNASLLEAFLNLSLSIALVFKFGLIGVAIGTLASTSFFTVYEVLYLSRNIVFRPLSFFIKQFLLDIISVVVMFSSTFWINIATLSYTSWFTAAVEVSLICFVECLLIQFAFSKEKVIKLEKIIMRKFKR